MFECFFQIPVFVHLLNVHWVKWQTLLSSTQSNSIILRIFSKQDVGQLAYVLIGKVFFVVVLWQFVVTCCITFRVTFLRTQKMAVLTWTMFPSSPESPCRQQTATDEQGEVYSPRLSHWHLQFLMFVRGFFGRSLQRIFSSMHFPHFLWHHELTFAALHGILQLNCVVWRTTFFIYFIEQTPQKSFKSKYLEISSILEFWRIETRMNLIHDF